MVPIAAVFGCPGGWRRVVMALYTAGLAALALRGTALTALSGARMDKGLLFGHAGDTLVVVLLGTVISTWIAFALSRHV